MTIIIKQKILIEIEKYQIQQNNVSDQTYILYLPFNEIHDLGLLFLHHEIVTKGHHSIYLGRSLPIENLLELKIFNPEKNLTNLPITLEKLVFFNKINDIKIKIPFGCKYIEKN